MKAKAKFTMSIMLLTVLFIGGLSVVFIIGMMMYVEGEASPSRVVFLTLGTFVGGAALKHIIKLNKEEQERRVDAVVDQHHEYLDQWVVPPRQWQHFLEKRLRHGLSEAKGYGYTFGGILAVIVAIVAFQQYPSDRALIITLTVGVLGFVLAFFIVKAVARKRFDKGWAFSQAEVFFAHDLIVLNGQLLQLQDFGVKLLKTELLSEPFDMPVLSFQVQTGIGNRSAVRQHWVPVPEDKKEDAEKLLIHYQSL